MKFLIILSTLVVASFSYPVVKTWTLNELSTAIETKSDPDLQPYLEDALNTIMYALITGDEENIMCIIPSPTGDKTWTIDQLRNAVVDFNIKPAFEPFIRRALQQLINLQADGSNQINITVDVPALDISVWTIKNVQNAKEDSATNPALLPYLKEADIKIKEALEKGEEKENVRVTLVTHVGLVPVESGTVPELIPRSSL